LLEGKSAKELQRSVDEDKNYHDKELVDHLKRMENAGNMEELDTINGKVPRYGIGDDSIVFGKIFGRLLPKPTIT